MLLGCRLCRRSLPSPRREGVAVNLSIRKCSSCSGVPASETASLARPRLPGRARHRHENARPAHTVCHSVCTPGPICRASAHALLTNWLEPDFAGALDRQRCPPISPNIRKTLKTGRSIPFVESTRTRRNRADPRTRTPRSRHRKLTAARSARQLLARERCGRVARERVPLR